KEAEKVTKQSPTEAQKKAGNYSKGKVSIRGFPISIENPVGSIRSGIDKDGNEWSNTTKHTYGYFRGTVGKDGDPIDVYLGDNFDDFDVYVIDQIDPTTRAFDEHKVMFGFNTPEEAKEAYLSEFEDGWGGFGSITTMTLKYFQKWLYNRTLTQRPANRLKLQIGNSIVSIGTVNKEPIIAHASMMEEVVEGVTLKNIQSQIPKEFDVLILEIGSPGGNVLEGFRIMEYLNGLSEQGKSVVTVVSANAYSIASLIMLVADYRVISNYGEVMIHNPMVPTLQFADASTLEKYASELRDLENVLVQLYCMFTGLEPEVIKGMMSKETFIGPDEAVELGFMDEVLNMNKKPYVSASKSTKHKVINMSKTINILRRVISMVNGSEFINQVYDTVDGESIEIFQSDPSGYKVGDRTSVEEGIFKLSDGTIKVDDYIIVEIDKSAAEAPAEAPVVETPVSEFNVGPAPKKPVAEEVPTREVPVAEETKVVETPVETPVSEEIPVEEEGVVAKLQAVVSEMQETIKGLQEKITEMANQNIEEKVVEISNELNKMKAENQEFEEMATEAIDKIASHASSVWNSGKPETPQIPQGNSIFKRALAAKKLATARNQ
ncbi:MAG: hypothetical protein GX971_14500, partial [Firmicutes bacterium]|nr:hypothetical protein [Bacillota bacterium]